MPKHAITRRTHALQIRYDPVLDIGTPEPMTSAASRARILAPMAEDFIAVFSTRCREVSPAGAREEQERNPAIGKTDAGRTPKALPVHPWSRRYGLRSARFSAETCRSFDRRRLRTSVLRSAHASPRVQDRHQHVLAAIVRLNEIESFLAVEPLYGSSRHKTLPFSACTTSRIRKRSRLSSRFWKKSPVCTRLAACPVIRPNSMIAV
jgi:hypothetical protein